MRSAATTARGRATRARIVQAASDLIRERGSAATSLDDILERADASKSQLYHYFEHRDALLRAVVDHNADLVLGGLAPLDGWAAIRSWFASLVELQRACGACGGCPVGGLVGQFAETDEPARLRLADAFERWEAHLRVGLRAMQARGKLAATADVDALATATLASLQGGLLLTQTTRDPRRLEIALAAAYEHLRTSRATV
jgi:TetR/AcrR family transcriptional regulator, transcriptional repressor for nem operon